MLLNSAVAGFGNFGQNPRPPKQSLRGLPAWVRDEEPTAQPAPTDVRPATTPGPDSVHNIAPTGEVGSTPGGNSVGTIPAPVATAPAAEPTSAPLPTEVPPPTAEPTKPSLPTSTDVPPPSPVPSDTPVPAPTVPTEVVKPSTTTIPTAKPIPTTVETTVPTTEPTTAPPAATSTPTSAPKPVDPSATPVAITATPDEPTPTVAIIFPTKLPTRAPTRVPIGTIVKVPTGAVPIITATPPENSVPDIPKDKGEVTPVVDIKPSTTPNVGGVGGTVMAPTNPVGGVTGTPIVAINPTEKSPATPRPQQDGVFLPAMPAVEPTSVIPASPTPKSLEEFVQTSAPKNNVTAPQFVGPILVYTYTQKMLAEGLYVVAACVANVGDQPDASVTLSFNSVAPVVIQHLLSASEFGEIDQNQRGFVNIASLPPDRQKQFELVVTAPEMPLPELMSINLSRGYKLNRPDEAKIKCEPQGTLSKLPEFAPVEITIGGEEVPPGTIAELAAKQLNNPTQRALDAKNLQHPSNWNLLTDNTYLVFVGVIAAMAGVFGLMTISRRMRP